MVSLLFLCFFFVHHVCVLNLQINGQRGYFDRYFVKEIQVIVAQPQHVVATEVKMFIILSKPSVY